MPEVLPEDLPFKTPPDLASTQQTRFAFNRLGKRLDVAWDAIGILNASGVSVLDGGGIQVTVDDELYLALGDGLYFGVAQEITVGALSPVTVDSGVVQLLYSTGLEVVSESLAVKHGDTLKVDGDGRIDVDYLLGDITSAITNRHAIVTDTAGVPYRVLASTLWYLGYGFPAGLTTNTFGYVNLPFSAIGSSGMTQSQWNNVTWYEINNIFLQIIQFCESLKVTVNANSNALASKGL